MNFGFTEEQDFLRDSVRKLLDERCPMSVVRQQMTTPNAHSPELWEEMASLGWLGLLIPEEHGGAGLTWIDFVVLLEETGRSLLPSPLLSNALAATAVLEAGSPAQQRRWLPGLADGSRIGTLALLEGDDIQGAQGVGLPGEVEGDDHVLDGTKHFVADAGCADLFVVAYRVGDELHLAVVPADAAGVSVELVPSLDETKRTGTLRLNGVRVGPGDRLEAAPSEATIDFLSDCGAIAVTAEALGAAEGALALTVQYAKDRVQFGSPIGRYQGVKHRLSDMWVDTESIKSLVYYGAWAIDDGREELPRYASLSKAYVADAFTRIGVDCVQLHGAVGYTLEYDIQLYLKRSKWARPMYGDSDYHRDRLATLRSL
jgi:alkylation response protein AidB-like acyl-CoA dehydrogenase